MATLEEARTRLEIAVDRLDGAITKSLIKAEGDDSAVQREAIAKLESERDALRSSLESLRADHEKLSAALRDAQENYAATQVVNEAVAGRLDAALGQVKQVLGG